MTPLRKPVTRLSYAVEPRTRRQLVVTLHGAEIELRPKGKRYSLRVPILSCWYEAARIRAKEIKEEKKAKRKATKSS